MFVVWTVYASLPATPPTPLIPLPSTSNGSRAHRFAPTTVLGTSAVETESLNNRRVK
jgi:hypothetical protein